MERLINSLPNVVAVNEPKRTERGNPDFIFLNKSQPELVKGYAEAKDVGTDLAREEASEQMSRYVGFANLILTDYIEWRFYRNGIKYNTIRLGSRTGKSLHVDKDALQPFHDELIAFLSQEPEKITSGKRLAEIMGQKARRIRRDAVEILEHVDHASTELGKILELVKRSLVHDLDDDSFADMYAQTLVYGLFVARYNDPTSETFSRGEARTLIPASNPFLVQFFDHIAGANFERSLAYVVSELVEVFRVSDVKTIASKHLAAEGAKQDSKDPIIHFYEDFLREYDAVEKRNRGVFYTPTPVVRYIVRAVDTALKTHFAIPQGLADTSKTVRRIESGGLEKARGIDRRRTVTQTYIEHSFHRVQILDPAVGTATFLNEVIRFIHAGMAAQAGTWPDYVREDLIPRINGFELMMAPYTIAHLKLEMTLSATGVDKIQDRLGVYLTNTLEPPSTIPRDLFSFGLAEAITEESIQAAEIKTERPIMCVIGNPPYSGISSNETSFANQLVERYKVEPGGSPLLEIKHWLNDDYVKFIAFAEQLVARNGEGIVAMITNHGYLDSLGARGMRWRLCQTFDFIHVIDLHGNSKNGEVAPDGRANQNVFDITQGVAIIIAVKDGSKDQGEDAAVFRADLWGTRSEKFAALDADDASFEPITLRPTRYFFADHPTSPLSNYSEGVDLKSLFKVSGIGVVTARDTLTIDFDRATLWDRVKAFAATPKTEAYERFSLRPDVRDWTVATAQADVIANLSEERLTTIGYRPFDKRWTFYTGNSRGFYSSPCYNTMRHMLGGDNLGIAFTRRVEGGRRFADIFVFDSIMSLHGLSIKETNTLAPLYQVDAEGHKTSNLSAYSVDLLSANLDRAPSPLEIFDYVYGLLQSPSYRREHEVDLSLDFARVAIPASQDIFDRYSEIGGRLRKLHLMTDPVSFDLATTFPVVGSNVVGPIRFEDDAVWINRDQYFGGVAPAAWTMSIGGYRPVERYLLDRAGRRLTNQEILHYQRVVYVLTQTDQLMQELG
jgi:predicted helicase